MGQAREPDLHPVGILIGEPVTNPAGDELGSIEEIMIDVDDGVIGYAIMSFQEPCERGDRLIAVPWRSLRYDPENGRFLLDAAPETLASAPGFDRGHWPRMGDRGWGEQIHRYYGQIPYWRQPSPGESPAASADRGGERKFPFH